MSRTQAKRKSGSGKLIKLVVVGGLLWQTALRLQMISRGEYVYEPVDGYVACAALMYLGVESMWH
jgi:hypothetical protein